MVPCLDRLRPRRPGSRHVNGASETSHCRLSLVRRRAMAWVGRGTNLGELEQQKKGLMGVVIGRRLVAGAKASVAAANFRCVPREPGATRLAPPDGSQRYEPNTIRLVTSGSARRPFQEGSQLTCKQAGGGLHTAWQRGFPSGVPAAMASNARRRGLAIAGGMSRAHIATRMARF